MIKSLFKHAFGHPSGVVGWIGGMIMARTNQEVARQSIELLDVQPRDLVLDIGCGPGVSIQLLSPYVSSGWVVGLDPSQEMVKQATRRNANDIGRGKAEIRRGVAERLPFENATFDKVLAINSMHVWPDALAGLREVERVLKPGGKVVLGFTRHASQSQDGLVELLTAAGFTDAKVLDNHENFYAYATHHSQNNEGVNDPHKW